MVWKILNALRAHDDEFNATVNKIHLNKVKPPKVVVARDTARLGPGCTEGWMLDPQDQQTGATELSNEEIARSWNFVSVLCKMGSTRRWSRRSEIACIGRIGRGRSV